MTSILAGVKRTRNVSCLDLDATVCQFVLGTATVVSPRLGTRISNRCYSTLPDEARDDLRSIHKTYVDLRGEDDP